jgi:hypothetical protein
MVIFRDVVVVTVKILRLEVFLLGGLLLVFFGGRWVWAFLWVGKILFRRYCFTEGSGGTYLYVSRFG